MSTKNTLKKVAYISPALMYPARGGPYLRVCTSVQALNSVCELHLLSTTPLVGESGKRTRTYYSGISSAFVQIPESSSTSTRLQSIFILLESNQVLKQLSDTVRASLLFEICMYFLRERVERAEADVHAQKIMAYSEEHAISILWISYASISTHLIAALSKRAANLYIIADTDSVWSEFIGRGIPFESSYLRKCWLSYLRRTKEKQERNFCLQAHCTTAVSEIDARYYKKLVGKKNTVKLFSNALNLTAYKPNSDTVRLQKNKKKSVSLFFSGSFGPHSPNTKAVEWFCQKILPIILLQSDLDITFIIAGSRSESLKSVLSHPSVRILGTVDDMTQEIQKADIVVVPLQFESGTRYKIIEAGASSKPVVSTSLGAEGLNLLDKKEILIADTAEAFATAVTLLIQREDIRKKLANNLYTKIKRCYSVEALQSEATAILDSCVEN